MNILEETRLYDFREIARTTGDDRRIYALNHFWKTHPCKSVYEAFEREFREDQPIVIKHAHEAFLQTAKMISAIIKDGQTAYKHDFAREAADCLSAAIGLGVEYESKSMQKNGIQAAKKIMPVLRQYLTESHPLFERD